MRINKVGVLTSIAFLAAASWIMVTQFDTVWPNIEASFVWAVPSFVVSHVILHRKINKVHETIKGNNTNDNRLGSIEAEEGSGGSGS